jgi:hypothetical protein
MIPKTIHYCWFGKGQLPDLAIKCITSWKKYLPDYEIKLWNEENFDVNAIPYVKEAYFSRKFAFVTDYVRLFALYTEGGVYMDTDVEILKNIDQFLNTPAFSGFETDDCIPTGIIGAEKNSLWAKEQLDYYCNISFIKSNGAYNLKTNVQIITENMSILGFIPNNKFQIINNYFYIYPKDFFCPKSHETGIVTITENTYCIHHFSGSWLKISIFEKKMTKIFGDINGNRIIKLSRLIKKFYFQTIKIRN